MLRILLLLAALLLLASAAHAQSDAVPVQQVVLYKSGVGYFEHAGPVQGTRTVALRFPTEQINDVLKSLVVEDAGGQVGAVVYPSQDPVARTLARFAVDLSGSPSLGALLNQLRGAEVTVALEPAGEGPGSEGPGETVRGTIVGAEQQQVRLSGGAAAQVWHLTLLTGGGLRRVRLDAARRIELADPQLRRELSAALQTLAEQQSDALKPLRITFRGPGARRVRLGYVVEAPIWKTSYRLLLPTGRSEGDATLQGWAIVENQTDSDWDGVRLALVSGRPISFVQNLYAPQYANRPVVQGPGYDPVAPPQYEAGIQNRNGSASSIQIRPGGGPGLRGVVRDAQSGQALPGANVVLGGGRYGTSTDRQGRFTLRDVQPGTYPMQVSFVGFQQATTQVQVGSDGARATVRLAPASSGLEEVTVTGRTARGQTASFAADAAEAPEAAPAPLDPTAGVEATGTAGAVGEVFRYDVGSVTLPRQRSAMIPVVAQSVAVERVSIYNARVLRDHPLRGARLTNSTALNLAPGPVTVLSEGTYAGDAQLPYLAPGQRGLLAYAVDQDVQMNTDRDQKPATIQTGRIADGVLSIQRRRIYETTYTAQNDADRARRLVIEQPRRGGTSLHDTPEPFETTDALYRFRLRLGAGDTETFTVQQAQPLSETIRLLDASDDRLRAFAAAEALPGDVRRALRRAIGRQRAVAVAERAAARLREELRELGQEQNRIRQNMQAVDRDSDYFGRLLGKLQAQEDRIEQLQERLDEAEARIEDRREALREELSGLDAG